MTHAPTHPTADELSAFLNGRLPVVRQSAVEQHVDGCPSCLNVLSRVPEGGLARLAREAVQRVSVSDPTPLPGSLRAE
jgi:anti-sigma factor RsiW